MGWCNWPITTPSFSENPITHSALRIIISDWLLPISMLINLTHHWSFGDRFYSGLEHLWSKLEHFTSTKADEVYKKQALMWMVVSWELNFLIILLFFNSTDSFELNKFDWNEQFTQIPQWIHFYSSINSLRFLNEFTQIHK